MSIPRTAAASEFEPRFRPGGAARVGTRGPGHPGADYVPELIALAGRARPTGRAPVLEVETVGPVDLGEMTEWLGRVM